MCQKTFENKDLPSQNNRKIDIKPTRKIEIKILKGMTSVDVWTPFFDSEITKLIQRKPK
jgi:hypothetical protein